MEASLRLPIGTWVVVPEVIQRGKNPPVLGKGYDIGRLSLIGKAAQKMHASGGHPPPLPFKRSFGQLKQRRCKPFNPSDRKNPCFSSKLVSWFRKKAWTPPII
jgi:hypothetical protein